LIERIVSVLFPLFAIASLGFVVGRRRRPDLSELNQLNMDVFTPALVFSALAGKSVQLQAYAPLALGATLLIAGSGVVAWAVARAARIDPRTLVPPMMFNNCGNLGLPLAVLAFGDAALAPAVVMFAVSNTLHFSFGTWYMDHETNLSNVWRVPSVLAALAGLSVSGLSIELWPPLLTAITLLGNITVPFMLFALGVRLSQAQIRDVRFGAFGAMLRPITGMLLATIIAHHLALPGEQAGLLLVFGALPPAVLNYMFAERYRQEPDKVASMVLLGNLAAVLFLPIALAWVL